MARAKKKGKEKGADLNIAVPGQLHKDKYKHMNELQKYKEIQRRTKLLYGVKDIKRMIDKSKESQIAFDQDICSDKNKKDAELE